MLYAINRQKIIDEAYKGSATSQNGPVPATVYHSLENPNFAKEFPDLASKYQLRVYEYNPAKANAILDVAGWQLGTDGIRTKAGQKLTFRYSTTRSFINQTIQALVANDLKQVGIDAQIDTAVCGYYCPPNYVSIKCQLCQLGFTAVSTSNFDAWDSYELSTEPDYDRPNIQHYSNPKVDAANRLFKTSIDRATLAEQSAIIQTELLNDAAIIPIAQRANIVIYSGKMRGRKPTNSTVPDWWNIGQWYFVP